MGAANLRHFVLLLLFVVAGAAYGLAAGLAMGWADRRALLRHTRAVLGVSRRGGGPQGIRGALGSAGVACV